MLHGHLSEAFVSFQGEGVEVGRRHLFVRFSGCPLRCRYCDTPASLVPNRRFTLHLDEPSFVENPIGVDDAVSALGKILEAEAGPVDGTAFTGGEPLSQAPFLAAILATGQLPRPYLLETSGTVPAALEPVLPFVDLISMDIKLPSNTGEIAFWSEHRRFLQMATGRVYVKVLVDDTTSVEDVREAARLVAAVDPATAIFVQPICDSKHNVSIGSDRLNELFLVARGESADVRVVPQTHKMLNIR